eukprot:5197155-Pleurochrysis_carterae.AAC.1
MTLLFCWSPGGAWFVAGLKRSATIFVVRSQHISDIIVDSGQCDYAVLVLQSATVVTRYHSPVPHCWCCTLAQLLQYNKICFWILDY